LRDTIRKEKE
jgi:hypothetical protein